MRIPVEGERLIGRDGVWIVETVTSGDADFFLAELVAEADAGDMGAMGAGEFDPDEFAAFCAEHGIAR